MRTLCLGCALVALALATPAAQAPPRPHIVMFFMDDLGYGDVASYGGPDARTPNIDRLAREGVKLTDFYANHANCSPTRTGLITGRYQQRTASSRRSGTDDPRHLPPLETSLPRLLKNAGYDTGLIGKWHLGRKRPRQPESSRLRRVLGISSWRGRLLHAHVATTAEVKLDPPSMTSITTRRRRHRRLPDR